MAWILSYVVFIVCLILGAIWISNAITDFKNKKYFQFGIDAMCVLTCVFCIAKYIFVIF